MPKKVIMYTTTWCPDCRNAKRYLDARGITYEEVDIEKAPEAAKKLIEWSGGYRTVPTFDIDGEIVVDFDRPKLDRIFSGMNDSST
ncbi:MAG: glutaredoxin family protein [Dehalococcoidia bacterium]|nr:glutaredoxin family protein [Dehalococcoidia bacterium]